MVICPKTEEVIAKKRIRKSDCVKLRIDRILMSSVNKILPTKVTLL
jgi:hypothetical protein